MSAAKECLEDLKVFLKNSQENKLSKNAVLDEFKTIQNKYCGKNLCNMDSDTKSDFEDFVSNLQKELTMLKKKAMKGGKKRKTLRRYKKKNKTKKRQRKGGEFNVTGIPGEEIITDQIEEAAINGVVFAIQCVFAYAVLAVGGFDVDPQAIMAAFW